MEKVSEEFIDGLIDYVKDVYSLRSETQKPLDIKVLEWVTGSKPNSCLVKPYTVTIVLRVNDEYVYRDSEALESLDGEGEVKERLRLQFLKYVFSQWVLEQQVNKG